MSTPFEELYPMVYPDVLGCPEMLIETNMRRVVQDFCGRTSIEKYEMDPVTVVEGLSEYDLEAPSGMMVHSVYLANLDGNPLTALNEKLVEARFPRHREFTGSPEGYVRKGAILWLYPQPDRTIPNGLYVTTVVKPNMTSTDMPDVVFTDHHEAIVAGTLARLMLIPNRDWSNPQLAQFHAAAYESKTQIAERRARKADENATPVTRYGGIGGGPKRNFRKGWR